MNTLYKWGWNFMMGLSIVLKWWIIFAVIGVAIAYAFDSTLDTGPVVNVVTVAVLAGAFLLKAGSEVRSKLPYSEEEIEERKEEKSGPIASTKASGYCPSCRISVLPNEVQGGIRCPQCGGPLDVGDDDDSLGLMDFQDWEEDEEDILDDW